ncbi:MAG: hypothetical protein KIPDCIKN_04052 [Haliscomenobacter sp.]|nr:hypothetical protein [Haliscomenobacter sp.]
MEAILIFLALILGALFPQAHEGTFLIRPFLMIMLFYNFLNVPLHARMVTRLHLWVALAKVGMPVLFYFLILPFSPQAAITAFVTGMAPTAAVAPVIAGLFRRKVEFVTVSVLLTSPLIALTLPLILPLLLPVEEKINVFAVLGPVTVTVFIPLLIAWLIRNGASFLIPWIDRTRKVPFILFLFNIFTAGADASNYLQYRSQESFQTLFEVAAVTVICGTLYFLVGQYFIGRKEYGIESGLALGRKNTMFGLWVALTYVNPIAALGPVFYIVYSNLYNTVQLYVYRRRERTPSP